MQICDSLIFVLESIAPDFWIAAGIWARANASRCPCLSLMSPRFHRRCLPPSWRNHLLKKPAMSQMISVSWTLFPSPDFRGFQLLVGGLQGKSVCISWSMWQEAWPSWQQSLKIDISRPTLPQTSSLINWASGFKFLLEATDRQWSANILTEGALHLKGGGSMGKGKGQNLSICNHMIGM